MSKPIFAIFLSFISVNLLADTFTSSSNSTPQLAPLSVNSMSAVDFSKTVTQISTNAQNQFKQGLTQKIDQTPAPRIYDADKGGAGGDSQAAAPPVPQSAVSTNTPKQTTPAAAKPSPNSIPNNSAGFGASQATGTKDSDAKSGWDVKY